MSNFDQLLFVAEFAENPEPRCPCILLLDTSASMSGKPIDQLNEGLLVFKSDLVADDMSAKRVEVCVITFGPVEAINDFQTPDEFQPSPLIANNNTPMGEAIEKAIEKLDQRKEIYKQNGISYYRPWIFLITDGAPTDRWEQAASLIRSGENSKSFMFFAVGVDNANMDILKAISVREPIKLKGLQFKELFSWLSNSLSSVSHSTLGDQVPLVNPVSPSGWGMIE